MFPAHCPLDSEVLHTFIECWEFPIDFALNDENSASHPADWQVAGPHIDVLVLNDDAVFLQAELGSLRRAKEDEYMWNLRFYTTWNQSITEPTIIPRNVGSFWATCCRQGKAMYRMYPDIDANCEPGWVAGTLFSWGWLSRIEVA